MATGRIRTLKPELLEDAKTANLSDLEFRLFVSTILLVDDHGNARGDVAYIQGAALWASRHPRETVASALAELSRLGLLTFYDVRGQLFVAVTNWTKHQKVDKPSKPRMPLLTDHEASIIAGDALLSRDPRETLANVVARPSRDPRETLAPDRDLDLDLDLDPDRDRDQRTTLAEGSSSPLPGCSPGVSVRDLESIYRLYPRKEGKKAGLQRAKVQIKTAEQLERFRMAVTNYCQKLQAEHTLPKFVKHFDTFMSCWEDYLDPAVIRTVRQMDPQNLTARDLLDIAEEQEANEQCRVQPLDGLPARGVSHGSHQR